ncbi:MAG TPA: RimK/LysX family protein [Polyangiaceae bacterium]|nr:RimK/LysX family protein [Polyangiaceae bacterium]
MIGLAELVDLPEWRIVRLRAKVDTGARSSALHVENIVEVGPDRVRFEVILHRDRPERRVTVEAPVVRRTRVRSSTGRAEPRIFVRTTLRIGRIVIPVELGLVNRAGMLYRMLIGRTALGAQFLVDPSRRYLIGGAPPAARRSGGQRSASGARRSPA